MLLDAEDGLEVVAEAGDVTPVRAGGWPAPRVLVLDVQPARGLELPAHPEPPREAPETSRHADHAGRRRAWPGRRCAAGATGFVLKEARRGAS